MEIGKIVGTNIQNLRKSKNMTQKDLADLFCYTSNAVSKWERGETLPEIQTMKTIADYFGVTVDCLLTENGYLRKSEFQTKKNQNTRLVILTCLLISIICTIVAIIFVYFYQNKVIDRPWTIFPWSVPASCLVPLIVYRKEKKPILKFVFSTIFVWGLLSAIYIQFFVWNLFLVFLVGVPTGSINVIFRF